MKQNSPTRAQRQHSTDPADNEHALHHHASAQAYQHQRLTEVDRNTPRKCARSPRPHTRARDHQPTARHGHIFYPHGGAKPPDTLPRKTRTHGNAKRIFGHACAGTAWT